MGKRKLPNGLDYDVLKKMLEEAEIRAEKNRVKDLLVSVTGVNEGSSDYVFSITNSGHQTYCDLRIYYNRLLDAGNFGLDDTHMPSKSPEPPIEIDRLLPGRTIQIKREGYGRPERYDGPAITSVKLEFILEGIGYVLNQNKTAKIFIDLPNARRGEPRATVL